MPVSAPAAVLALLAGLAGSVQVALMGRFGDRIGIFPALAFSTLVTATIALSALLVSRRSLAGIGHGLHQPPWLWLAGVAGVFIVFTVTFAGPRIGVAATVGLMIAGQLAMAALIDRFGLFGSAKIALHAPRLLGILLLAAGAALSLRR